MARAGVPVDGGLGYQVIVALALRGVVCWGPTHRTQQALVLADEWLPADDAVDPDNTDAALRMFALRFARGHGPVQHADFAWWSGCTLTETRRAFDLARDVLVELDCGGERYWVAADDDATARMARLPASDRFRALPGYDEYLNGTNYRRLALRPARDRLLFHPGNAAFQRSVIDRGEVIAAWRPAGRPPRVMDEAAGEAAAEVAANALYAFTAGGVSVTAESAEPLSDARLAGAAAAIARWAEFGAAPPSG